MNENLFHAAESVHLVPQGGDTRVNFSFLTDLVLQSESK